MTDLLSRARSGDRRALARLISAIEAGAPDGRDALAELTGSFGNAYVVGITGAPGAGKSTLTNALVRRFRDEGSAVAVVAVDPSSPFTGGAILGDRIRMQDHSGDDGVFIRSMGSRGHLGGVAAATPQVVALLDGVGFPTVIVETVGVGQAEVEIVESADTTIVVVTPGWGDSVQANKAGLLEIGDIFVVNKADRPGVEGTVKDLRQMLALGAQGEWTPPIITTVATSGEGVDELRTAIDAHREHLEASGRLPDLRADRLESAFRRALAAELASRLGDRADFQEMADRVRSGKIDPWTAARDLAG